MSALRATVSALRATASAHFSTVSALCLTVSALCPTVSAHCSTVSAHCSTVSAHLSTLCVVRATVSRNKEGLCRAGHFPGVLNLISTPLLKSFVTRYPMNPVSRLPSYSNSNVPR